jgi:hypothetical protein
VIDMHRSRLAGFIIDCQDASLDDATRFWSGALGYEATPNAEDAAAGYVPLDTRGGLHIEVQRVDHESRLHLDIESDDVEAEVMRLEALGARRIRKVRTWWVMEAPTGQRFCVVRARGGDFAANSNRWA